MSDKPGFTTLEQLAEARRVQVETGRIYSVCYSECSENRTRFLQEVVTGIRAEVPTLGIGVRLSAFDFVPFRSGPDGRGEPVPVADDRYPYAFGGDGTGLGINLTEPCAFLDLLAAMEIELVCISAGSPYYNPHIQRPALFPPSDGYQPPEDPLVGVARQIGVTASLKQHRPNLAYVGSAYSYTTYEIVKGTYGNVPFSTEPFETYQVFPKILDRPPVARGSGLHLPTERAIIRHNTG